MKKGYFNILLLLFLLVVDVFYLYPAFTAQKNGYTVVGMYAFPKIIGALLALLCALIMVKTLRERDTRDELFEIQNLKLILCTILAMALLIILWEHIGFFYVLACLFLLLLLFLFRTEGGRFSRKNIMINMSITVFVVLFIFLLFKVVMQIRM